MGNIFDVDDPNMRRERGIPQEVIGSGILDDNDSHVRREIQITEIFDDDDPNVRRRHGIIDITNPHPIREVEITGFEVIHPDPPILRPTAHTMPRVVGRQIPISKRNKFLSKGERECRDALESMYPGYKFPPTRPGWLINPKTGYAMELDCYCEELMIAVEFNGKQHYEYTPKFKYDLDDYKERDAVKKVLCKQRGVLLIIIKYDVKKIYNYILKVIRNNPTHPQPEHAQYII